MIDLAAQRSRLQQWLRPALQQWLQQWLQARPPRQQYLRSWFYAVLLLGSAVLLLSLCHANAVSERLEQAVLSQLGKRPWFKQYVALDGREVHLIGRIEPQSGVQREIDLILATPGVTGVVNHLEEVPRPAPQLHARHRDARLTLEGQLNGDHLEHVVAQFRQAFPDSRVTDRVKIDDRLGRPLWMDGLQQGLRHLAGLEYFSLIGWRDQMVLSGTVDDFEQARRIGYGFPVSLIEQVKVENRLRSKTPPGVADLTLTVDWSGVRIATTVAGQALAGALEAGIEQVFGADGLEQEIQIRVDPDSGLKSGVPIEKLLALLPALAPLRDLHLQTGGTKIQLWGRADNPHQLGRLIDTIARLGLEQQVRNQVVVAPGQFAPVISLFASHKRATITGVLPNQYSRRNLIQAMRKQYHLEHIDEFVSVQPNIAFEHWIQDWPYLLSVLPTTAVGLSIDANAVLVSGLVRDQAAFEQLEQRLLALFPQRRLVNWTQISALTPAQN